MSGKIKDVEIRQATADDVRIFYPEGPPLTVYAWIASYKGQPACLAGLTFSPGGCCAFSEILPGVDAPKRTIWLTAKELLRRIEALKMPMYAACEKHDKMAQKFVARLGFKRQRSYEDMELFVWQA